jgi:RNA polymerase sigma-70 factor (ECF subfamily)
METPMTPDAELVARVAGGDAEALAELYDRHGHTAYGLATRVLRDRALAEDAVQEAFLALWRTAASFDARRANVATWINVLVHRRAVDVVRRQERHRAEPLPETGFGGFDAAADDTAERHETAARVQAELARLPRPQREVIELAFYGGLSQAEIAEHLGVPLGTVKSRTFSALARLRDVLADEDPSVGVAAVGSQTLVLSAA